MFGSLKKLFGGEEREEEIIVAPVNETAVPVSQVSDPTFSQEILGRGTAVIPSDGRVVVPIDGLVTMIFDTEHAISMQTDNGAELIIHIGFDMVQLKGQYFDAHVVAGDKIKQDDPLLDFDIDETKEVSYDVTTPVIIYSMPQFPKMECANGMGAGARETAIIKL